MLYNHTGRKYSLDEEESLGGPGINNLQWLSGINIF